MSAVLAGFFRPTSSPASSDVLAVVRALEAVTSGEVTKPELLSPYNGRPDRDGALSTCVFGPLEELHCECGFLKGAERTGERCPKCRVECASPALRDQRCGHARLAVPLLHPRLAAEIADALGSTADAVLRIARGGDDASATEWIEQPFPDDWRERYCTGRLVTMLRARGADPALLVDVVPVTPPGTRPLVAVPGGQRMPDVDSALYQELIGLDRRLRSFVTLRSPLLVANAWAELQMCFETLVDVIAGAPRATMWLDRSPVAGMPELAPEPFALISDTADALAWIDEVAADDPSASGSRFPEVIEARCALAGRADIIVQSASGEVVQVRNGRVVGERFRAPGELMQVNPAGTQAWFLGLAGSCVRDFTAERWLTSDEDSDLSMFTCEARREQAHLVLHRRGLARRAWEVADAITVSARSPDGRFVWVEDNQRRGGVYEANGLCVLYPQMFELSSQPCPVLDLNTGKLAIDRRTRDPESSGPFALALDPAGVWWIVDDGVVARDGRSLFRLPETTKFAAFDRACTRLAVTTGSQIVVFGLDPLAVAARHHIESLFTSTPKPAPRRGKPSR